MNPLQQLLKTLHAVRDGEYQREDFHLQAHDEAAVFAFCDINFDTNIPNPPTVIF